MRAPPPNTDPDARPRPGLAHRLCPPASTLAAVYAMLRPGQAPSRCLPLRLQGAIECLTGEISLRHADLVLFGGDPLTIALRLARLAASLTPASAGPASGPTGAPPFRVAILGDGGTAAPTAVLGDPSFRAEISTDLEAVSFVSRSLFADPDVPAAPEAMALPDGTLLMPGPPSAPAVDPAAARAAWASLTPFFQRLGRQLITAKVEVMVGPAMAQGRWDADREEFVLCLGTGRDLPGKPRPALRQGRLAAATGDGGALFASSRAVSRDAFQCLLAAAFPEALRIGAAIRFASVLTSPQIEILSGYLTNVAPDSHGTPALRSYRLAEIVPRTVESAVDGWRDDLRTAALGR